MSPDSPDFDWFPAVSPDGRYVVFMSRRSGKDNMWRINIDGTDRQQLTDGEPGYYPVFSPDGRWVVYVSDNKIWRVPFAGGRPELVSNKPANYAAVAPDGKRIAYSSGEKSQIGIIAFDGGAELKTLDFNPNPNPTQDPLLRWLDDQSLLYVDASQGGANIWVLPLGGSRQPYPLTHFQSEQIWSFDVTPDRKQLAYSRGAVSINAVLLREEGGAGTPVH
jgi:Tol biopolymer transport system component